MGAAGVEGPGRQMPWPPPSTSLPPMTELPLDEHSQKSEGKEPANVGGAGQPPRSPPQ